MSTLIFVLHSLGYQGFKMDDEEELMHVNPCPPAWMSDEQKAALRGDNIEGTAYNERWLITTLTNILKAMQDLLPKLQKASNLTTYDFTPRKPSSYRDDGSPACTPSIHTPSAQQDATPLLHGDDTHRLLDDSCTSAPNTSLRSDPGTSSAAEGMECSAVDIPQDVEENSCQLWDMCADRSMALHVLAISDGLVLQLLSYSVLDPTAPRITEILCGVALNICCQSEGCAAILADKELLVRLVTLPERSQDTPMLVQAFSLLYRIFAHHKQLGAAQANRLQTADGESDAEKSKYEEYSETLSLVLHSCCLEQFLAYCLENSLNEQFIEISVKLLEKLVFFRDAQNQGELMAVHYAHDHMVHSLLTLVCSWHKKITAKPACDDHDDDDFEESEAKSPRADNEDFIVSDTVHSAFLCLYAFSDTRAVDAIVACEDEKLSLEGPLVHYISGLGAKIEKELRFHKSHSACHESSALNLAAERLGCAVRLLGVLLRSISLPEVIVRLARLLALLEHSGIVCDVEKMSGDDGTEAEGDAFTPSQPVANGQKNFSDGGTREGMSTPSSANKFRNILDKFDLIAVEKYHQEAKEREAKIKRRRKMQRQAYESHLRRRSCSRSRRRSSSLVSCIEDVTLVKDSLAVSCLSKEAVSELMDLRKCLEQYFAHILSYWFSFGDLKNSSGVLCSILRVLEQCHVPEVLLVFDAAKKIDEDLVAKIQEMLLDHQAFPRTVALLAQLYE